MKYPETEQERSIIFAVKCDCVRACQKYVGLHLNDALIMAMRETCLLILREAERSLHLDFKMNVRVYLRDPYRVEINVYKAYQK